jgi:hypothetical protein
MLSDTPPPTPQTEAPAEAQAAVPSPMEQRTDGNLVIDLTRLVPPPPPEDCADSAPDPFNPEIVVCQTAAPSPRLGPVIGPLDDGFGSAIPRARIKLTDTTSAELNGTNPSVGGFNAQGGEVRLKIDF